MITKGRSTRLAIIFIAFIGLVGLLFPVGANAESLSQLLARQADLQRQAQENKKKLEAKKQEVSDLRGVISDIDGDITFTESNIGNTEDQIFVTEGVISELNANIQQAQDQLSSLQTRLDSAYIGLYELSQTSTADSILSSGSLSDVVSQAQYIQVLQSDLQTNIRVANNLRAQLETKKGENLAQKASLDALKADLVKSRNALNNQRSQKNFLLAQTQGQQAQYEALLKKLDAEHATLTQEIYAERRRLGQGETVTGGTGGYWWPNEPNFYAADPWLFYKRQCVSYTAQKFLNVFGQVFYNTRPGQGSAWNWPALARDQGYQTSSTPRAISVVSWPANNALRMPVGHTAWVESVNSNGTINISEYNWVIERGYSERQNVDPLRYGNPTYIFP